MRAIGNRIILEPVEAKEVKVGSIVLPNIAIKDNAMWRVHSVGPEVKSLKPGDYVLCPVHAIYEVEMAGKSYAVVREDHIYAVLDESEVYG